MSYGIPNYNLGTEISQLTSVAVIVPSLTEAFAGRKEDAVRRFSCGNCLVMDVRSFADHCKSELLKELLFSRFFVVTSKYEKCFGEILAKGEVIARADEEGLLGNLIKEQKNLEVLAKKEASPTVIRKCYFEVARLSLLANRLVSGYKYKLALDASKLSNIDKVSASAEEFLSRIAMLIEKTEGSVKAYFESQPPLPNKSALKWLDDWAISAIIKEFEDASLKTTLENVFSSIESVKKNTNIKKVGPGMAALEESLRKKYPEAAPAAPEAPVAKQEPGKSKKKGFLKKN